MILHVALASLKCDEMINFDFSRNYITPVEVKLLVKEHLLRLAMRESLVCRNDKELSLTKCIR